MDNRFNPSISVEKFAAYLEGNLPEDEMLRISSLIENDDALKSIFDVSEQVDMSLEEYSSNIFQVPEDIVNMDFELPYINNTFKPLDMDSTNGIFTSDTVACSEIEDNSNECLYMNDSDTANKDYSNVSNTDDYSDMDNTQIPLDDK